MIRRTLKGFVLLAAAAAIAPASHAQQCATCQPTCAAPQGPMCGVPPVPGDPSCAAPSGCSTSGNCNTCYQPQQINCEPQHHSLFRSRPIFNWTKINIENREKCCQPQAQCCQPAQPTMAMPMMTMQPVQLQMTAYQPVMAAPQFVQAAPQFVSAPQMVAAPQFVSAPQMVAAPQFVSAPQMVAAPQFVSAPQMVAAPQVQQVTLRPQAAPQSGDDCNLNNVCEKLETLRKRVDDLSEKVAAQKDTSDLERRVTQSEQAVKKLEEASNLQTEILKDMKTYFEQKK